MSDAASESQAIEYGDYPGLDSSIRFSVPVLRRGGVLALVGAVSVFVLSTVFCVNTLAANVLDVVPMAKIDKSFSPKTVSVFYSTPNINHRLLTEVSFPKFFQFCPIKGLGAFYHAAFRGDYDIPRLVVWKVEYGASSIATKLACDLPRNVLSRQISSVVDRNIARKPIIWRAESIDTTQFDRQIGTLQNSGIFNLTAADKAQSNCENCDDRCGNSSQSVGIGKPANGVHKSIFSDRFINGAILIFGTLGGLLVLTYLFPTLNK